MLNQIRKICYRIYIINNICCFSYCICNSILSSISTISWNLNFSTIIQFRNNIWNIRSCRWCILKISSLFTINCYRVTLCHISYTCCKACCLCQIIYCRLICTGCCNQIGIIAADFAICTCSCQFIYNFDIATVTVCVLCHSNLRTSGKFLLNQIFCICCTDFPCCSCIIYIIGNCTSIIMSYRKCTRTTLQFKSTSCRWLYITESCFINNCISYTWWLIGKAISSFYCCSISC